MKDILRLTSLYFFLIKVESFKILAYFPTPSISHQIVFRALIYELLSRGHKIILITPDPAYIQDGGHANLTEIDLHDLTYQPWIEFLPENIRNTIVPNQMPSISEQQGIIMMLTSKIVEKQLKSKQVQKILTDESQKFDLILIEAYTRPALVLSEVFKDIPVTQMSSFGPIQFNMKTVGGPLHPIYYPFGYYRKINNLSIWDSFCQILIYLSYEFVISRLKYYEEEFMKKAVGSESPAVEKLANNVDMVFINFHPVWDMNRPVPPNVIYMGALHLKPAKELPKMLQTYLDNSKNGVIYISFGNNVDPIMFPPGAIEMFVKVLAILPYDVIWKWHTDDIPGLSKNIKISRWLPQADLLRHPKIKLFITQGGLQSIDEAIEAAVPMVAIPLMGDQWYNAELCVRHEIGIKLELFSMNADIMKDSILAVINHEKYRENIRKFRKIIHDQPQTPMMRVTWWTEYAMRHGGTKHLRSPAANMHWVDYYEVELLSYVLLGLVFVVLIVIIIVYRVLILIGSYTSVPEYKKTN